MSKHSWGTPLRSNIYRGRWPSTCQKVTFHIRWFVPVIIFGNFSSLCFKPYFYKNSKICFSSILLFITFGDSLGKNILKSTLYFPLLLFYRYGDRSPRSIAARIFSIAWTLTGLVIIGVLVGAIASSLTSVNVQKDITLYGTKVSSYRSAFKFSWKTIKTAAKLLHFVKCNFRWDSFSKVVARWF